MKVPVLLLSLLVVAAHSYAPLSKETNVDPKNETRAGPLTEYRLSDDILPSHYAVELTPYLFNEDGAKQFSFDGRVEITLRPSKAGVQQITLHVGKDVKLLSKLLKVKNGEEVPIVGFSIIEPTTDKYSLLVDNSLDTNTDYVLTFTYTGKLGDDMHGFYKSEYTNSKGEKVYIASTQFQTHHARRAFPCFDEPKFKAKFQITINHPSQFSVISNTLGSSTRQTKLPNGASARYDVTTTVFEETPIMSSYLVAFIVSDFVGRGSDTFKVFARPDAYDQTGYAYEVGPKLMASLDKFTDYPYATHGLKKMDLAGIPDFSAGAMENWGLLTYRETALLYVPTVSTLLNQQRVATVISHELAHMWFGDLVTCEWWGYTWLNEAFGRYFQYFTTHEVEPTWELDKQFVIEQVQTVMNMDSLSGTTPMSDPTAETPSDLSRMFNSISYNKAATIMRMTAHMMGQENFKKALQTHLKNRQFNTAVPQDLFNAFAGQYSGPGDISSILKDWTEQIGYPVVTITLASDGSSFTAKQKRFLLMDDGSDGSLLYQVPLTYTTSEDMDFTNTMTKVLLPKSKDETKVTLDKKASWILANIQEVGYYRVNYDDTNWENIRKALISDNHGQIHELNRAQIVDDVLNLARAGDLKYEKAIEILDYLKTETNYLPWYAALNEFSSLSIRTGVDNHEYFGAYILELLDSAYKSVGFDRNPSERRLVTYNRGLILSWACKYNHTNCVEDATARFQKYMNNNEPVEVNIRSAVYCTAVANGGDAEFNFLWNKFTVENVASEQVLILNALGCSRDRAILTRYLGLILSEAVRLQDRSAAFQATYTTYFSNADIVWDFVQNRYKDMIEAFNTPSSVATLINSLSVRFTTAEQRDSFADFIEKTKGDFGSSYDTLKTGLGRLDNHLKFTNERLPPFIKHIRGGASTIQISAVLVVAVSTLVRFVMA